MTATKVAAASAAAGAVPAVATTNGSNTYVYNDNSKKVSKHKSKSNNHCSGESVADSSYNLGKKSPAAIHLRQLGEGL